MYYDGFIKGTIGKLQDLQFEAKSFYIAQYKEQQYLSERKEKAFLFYKEREKEYI